ncbi:unnamed protein product [Gadus morhua 'NCC']
MGSPKVRIPTASCLELQTALHTEGSGVPSLQSGPLWSSSNKNRLHHIEWRLLWVSADLCVSERLVPEPVSAEGGRWGRGNPPAPGHALERKELADVLYQPASLRLTLAARCNVSLCLLLVANVSSVVCSLCRQCATCPLVHALPMQLRQCDTRTEAYQDGQDFRPGDLWPTAAGARSYVQGE